MKNLNLLALATAAIVVAACNGTSPTSPKAIVASDDATALAEATALNAQATPPVLGCRDITEVKLRVLPSLGSTRVEAQYFNGDAIVKCRIAPDWSSRPTGRLRYLAQDTFIVGVILTRPSSTVQVTAKAPTGVQGSIFLR